MGNRTEAEAYKSLCLHAGWVQHYLRIAYPKVNFTSEDMNPLVRLYEDLETLVHPERTPVEVKGRIE